MVASLLIAAALSVSAKENPLVAVCKTACVIPHDAQVIACKATKKGWWAQKKCVWAAAADKRKCERSCVKR